MILDAQIWSAESGFMGEYQSRQFVQFCLEML